VLLHLAVPTGALAKLLLQPPPVQLLPLSVGYIYSSAAHNLAWLALTGTATMMMVRACC
jgi:hypothetical protein